MSFYNFARNIATWLLPMICKVEYLGFERQPHPEEGYIICSNHVSNLDVILIARKIQREIHFLGKIELFKNRLLGLALKKLNVIPVNRGKGNATPLGAAIKVVNNGGVVGIFPEGTRSKDGKLGHPKSGALVVASASKANILPIGITIKARRLRRPLAFVKCGALIHFEDLMITEGAREELKQGANYVMNKISELLTHTSEV
ncbi:MAG: 1-acyl-sn-glycerol-3-phosphate acyltransferase [Oscillospiraceae bacterium]|jgi:1-acyl-sn-glycerol-3-phosphate acyltransferase|nr:1-acyl-sn-glycerol-3-phosphate acyltransferase [Oscillospiraceae bacterium]